MTSAHRRARCGRACSAADVGQSIEGQALELLAFLLGGALLGLTYDVLRPIRHAAGRGGGALDVFFCAAGGALFFVLAMRTGSGRMGTWSLAAAAVGFCIYMQTLSAVLLPVFAAIDAAAARAGQWCKKVIKKFCKYAKSIFQKSRECFIIKHKRKAD